MNVHTVLCTAWQKTKQNMGVSMYIVVSYPSNRLMYDIMYFECMCVSCEHGLVSCIISQV